MNWLDIVLILILAWSVAVSFRKGLTREIVGLASVILALAAGIWCYGAAGGYLAGWFSSRSVANFVGFASVFLAVMLAGALVNFILGRLWKVTGLSIVDHLFGAAFGAVRGILIAIALIMAIMAFSSGDRPPESVVRSRSAPYVANAARVIVAAAPYELKEGFRARPKRKRKKMKDSFDGLVQRLLNGGVFLEEAVEILERGMIEGALGRNGGNQSAASKQLGIHRNTLQRKIQEFGLENGRHRTRRKPAGRVARSRKGKKTDAA